MGEHRDGSDFLNENVMCRYKIKEKSDLELREGGGGGKGKGDILVPMISIMRTGCSGKQALRIRGS
jgi:hypothetical protein